MHGLDFAYEHFQCILFDDHTYTLIDDNGSLRMTIGEQEGTWEVVADNKEGTRVSLTPNTISDDPDQHEKREATIVGGLSAPEALEGLFDVTLPFAGSSIKHSGDSPRKSLEQEKPAASHDEILKEKFAGVLRGDNLAVH